MRILIIDDNQDDIALIRRHLEDISEEIVCATTAEEGIAKATEECYDCIVLDHLLPEESGLDALKRLRDSGTRTPVVIVTGCHDRLLATRCIQSGAQNYFPKDYIEREPELFQDCVSQTVNLQFLEASARLNLLDAQVRLIEARLNGGTKSGARIAS